VCADGILVDVTYIKTRGGIRQMTEEKEFLKEHPSFTEEDLLNWDESVRGWDDKLVMDRIHETQLDKQKVKEAIIEATQEESEEGYMAFLTPLLKKLGFTRKELGLE